MLNLFSQFSKCLLHPEADKPQLKQPVVRDFYMSLQTEMHVLPHYRPHKEASEKHCSGFPPIVFL